MLGFKLEIYCVAKLEDQADGLCGNNAIHCDDVFLFSRFITVLYIYFNIYDYEIIYGLSTYSGKNASSPFLEVPVSSPRCLSLAEWVIKVPYGISIGLDLLLGVTVSEILVSILRSISYLKILIPRLTQGLKVVQSAPWPDSCNGTVALPVLKPRPTRCGPDQSLH
jgi:hypothetical protein